MRGVTTVLRSLPKLRAGLALSQDLTLLGNYVQQYLRATACVPPRSAALAHQALVRESLRTISSAALNWPHKYDLSLSGTTISASSIFTTLCGPLGVLPTMMQAMPQRAGSKAKKEWSFFLYSMRASGLLAMVNLRRQHCLADPVASASLPSTWGPSLSCLTLADSRQ